MTSKIRVVLAGCGGITGAWLGTQAAKEHVEIVGLVDVRREAAEALRAKRGLGDVVVGGDIGEVIDRAKPEAVFDCTIPVAHPGVTIAALERGCHVLGEKPMAEDLVSARRMVEAARKAGKTYAVIQNRRYEPAIRRLQAFLRSGAIGQVHSLHADFFIAADFGGFRETMKHVLLVDMAVHSFDQARLLSGADAVAVQAMDWNPPGSWYRHGASANAVFELTGGGVFSYRGSWAATGAQTTWECWWRILGTAGAVTWDGADGMRAEVLADPKQPSAEKGGHLCKALREVAVPPLASEGFRKGHDGVIDEFCRSLRGGPTPETVCFDNYNTVAMVLAAVDSAESRTRVAIEPVARGAASGR
jgi:predicted dehydrogenase